MFFLALNNAFSFIELLASVLASAQTKEIKNMRNEIGSLFKTARTLRFADNYKRLLLGQIYFLVQKLCSKK